MPAGSLHHLELWVADLSAAERSVGWLLLRLGWREQDRWADGVSYARDEVYVVLEAGPDVAPEPHQRTRPGLNHLALRAGSRADLDALVGEALQRGWRLLFADRHPHAGGATHCAAYLEDPTGFEVELVAD